MAHGSDFSLVFSRALGKVVVAVQGALDADTAPTLRERLADIIDGQGNRQVVLDLQEMTAVDAAGLRVLMETLKRMEEYGGNLVLSGPNRFVAGQLRAGGLDESFLITPNWRHPAWGMSVPSEDGTTRPPGSPEHPGDARLLRPGPEQRMKLRRVPSGLVSPPTPGKGYE